VAVFPLFVRFVSDATGRERRLALVFSTVGRNGGWQVTVSHTWRRRRRRRKGEH
jgi:hypothetical protein